MQIPVAPLAWRLTAQQELLFSGLWSGTMDLSWWLLVGSEFSLPAPKQASKLPLVICQKSFVLEECKVAGVSQRQPDQMTDDY